MTTARPVRLEPAAVRLVAHVPQDSIFVPRCPAQRHFVGCFALYPLFQFAPDRVLDRCSTLRT